MRPRISLLVFLAVATLASVYGAAAAPFRLDLTQDQINAFCVAQGGCGTAAPGTPTPPAPPTPTPLPPPVVSSIPIVDIAWGNNRVFVTPPVAIRFTTGPTSSTWSLPFIAGAEYPGFGGSPSPRYAVLSETPGDFDHPLPSPTGAGGIAGPSNSIQLKFAIGTGSNFSYYSTLQTNKTYYLNVREYGGNGGVMFFDLSVNSL